MKGVNGFSPSGRNSFFAHEMFPAGTIDGLVLTDVTKGQLEGKNIFR